MKAAAGYRGDGGEEASFFKFLFEAIARPAPGPAGRWRRILI